jgi:ribosomal protein S18 acetylase RimI-like enzyme
MGYREPLVTRKAAQSDVVAVEHCVYSAYQCYLGRMARPPAPLLHDNAELIERGAVLVATIDDEVVGVLVSWLEEDHLHIDNLAVAPAWQGQGIGKALLWEANQIAASAGRDEIRLYTNEEMTENQAYYLDRGFAETHRTVEDGYSRAYYSCPVQGPDGTLTSRPSRLAEPVPKVEPSPSHRLPRESRI